jgi:hypothetical protein
MRVTCPAHYMPLDLIILVESTRDSVVGIATSYGLDDRGVGVRIPVESIIFFSPRRPDRLWDPQRIQWVPGTLSPGVQAAGA